MGGLLGDNIVYTSVGLPRLNRVRPNLDDDRYPFRTTCACSSQMAQQQDTTGHNLTLLGPKRRPHPGTEDADKASLMAHPKRENDTSRAWARASLALEPYGPPARPRAGSGLMTLDSDVVTTLLFEHIRVLSTRSSSSDLIVYPSLPPVFRRQRRLMRSPSAGIMRPVHSADCISIANRQHNCQTDISNQNIRYHIGNVAVDAHAFFITCLRIGRNQLLALLVISYRYSVRKFP